MTPDRVEAVSAAQRAGQKQSLPRSAKLGGREIEGAPLRFVRVADPPAVYFPDAHRKVCCLAAYSG